MVPPGLISDLVTGAALGVAVLSCWKYSAKESWFTSSDTLGSIRCSSLFPPSVMGRRYLHLDPTHRLIQVSLNELPISTALWKPGQKQTAIQQWHVIPLHWQQPKERTKGPRHLNAPSYLDVRILGILDFVTPSFQAIHTDPRASTLRDPGGHPQWVRIVGVAWTHLWWTPLWKAYFLLFQICCPARAGWAGDLGLFVPGMPPKTKRPGL